MTCTKHIKIIIKKHMKNCMTNSMSWIKWKTISKINNINITENPSENNTFPNLFSETSIAMMPKLGKNIATKENDRPKSFMSMTKIFNKMLTNEF